MKKVILVIAILLIGFIKVNVYAYSEWPSADNITFTIGSNTASTTSKVYTSAGNVIFRAQSDEIFVPSYDSNQIKYGYYSVCASSKFTLSTYNSGTYSKNVKVYMTDIPCQIYNSSAYPNSRVLYMTFDLNLGLGGSSQSDTMCTTGVSSTLCELNNRITIYVPSNQEWTLNSYGFAPTPFEFDASQGTLINQNTTIINQNNQMINKIDSMVSSQNQTNDILNQNHTYNKNASETINGQSDINNQTQAEDNLMNSLDFSGANNLDISINADSSNFIWSIVERLRLLPKITLFMTSVLGLGIIKMILNR